MAVAALVQLVLPMALILGLMYVMIILPQKKRIRRPSKCLIHFRWDGVLQLSEV